jgi:hypothetical protein
MRKRESSYEHGVHQTPVSKLTVKELIHSAAFVRGFNEARQGKPFDYDAFADKVGNQWHYERGRALGVIWDGHLKIGKRVTMSAIVAANQAFVSRDLI